MTPIWTYTRKMRHGNANTHRPLKKSDGEHTQNLKEELARWKEWIQECFYKTPEQTIPEITHIAEQEWGQIAKKQKKKQQ